MTRGTAQTYLEPTQESSRAFFSLLGLAAPMHTKLTIFFLAFLPQ
jgi:hypothetical protein